MTWDTVNVLTIPWAGEIAGKLAGKILDVLEMYWVGTGWVHYPFPCSVLAMYWLGTPPLAPSETRGRGRGQMPVFILVERSTIYTNWTTPTRVRASPAWTQSHNKGRELKR